jgi:HIRAN domain
VALFRNKARIHDRDVSLTAVLMRIANTDARLDELTIKGFDFSIQVDGEDSGIIKNHELGTFIADGGVFYVKVAGISFTANIVKTRPCLKVGSEVLLQPEPENPKDAKALRIVCAKHGRHRIGYVPAEISHSLNGAGNGYLVREFWRDKEKVGAQVVGSVGRHLLLENSKVG